MTSQCQIDNSQCLQSIDVCRLCARNLIVPRLHLPNCPRKHARTLQYQSIAHAFVLWVAVSIVLWRVRLASQIYKLSVRFSLLRIENTAFSSFFDNNVNSIQQNKAPRVVRFHFPDGLQRAFSNRSSAGAFSQQEFNNTFI